MWAGLGLGLLAFAAGPASAYQFYTLDFEGFSNGTILTNQYAAQHATFDVGATPWHFLGGTIVTPPAGIPTHSGVNAVNSWGPLTIHFDVDVFQWSAYFALPGDWFQNGVDVYAYDAAGNLLGANAIMNSGNIHPTNQYLDYENFTTGFRTLQINSYISLPAIIQGQSWMDDMSYTTAGNPVPEPASLLLLGTGLLGSFVARRKLRK